MPGASVLTLQNRAVAAELAERHTEELSRVRRAGREESRLRLQQAGELTRILAGLAPKRAAALRIEYYGILDELDARAQNELEVGNTDAAAAALRSVNMGLGLLMAAGLLGAVLAIVIS